MKVTYDIKDRAASSEPRKVLYDCPICNNGHGKLDATRKPPGSDPPYFVGCWSMSCQELGNREFIRELAEIVKAPNAYALLEDPIPYLDAALDRAAGSRNGTRSTGAEPEPLPHAVEIRQWESQLWEPTRSATRARHWLKSERGLSTEVMRAARLGWDGKRVIFTLRRRAQVVNVKTRYPRAGQKLKSWPGWTAAMGSFPLFPEPGDERWLLVCEGELDALRARSLRLPAVSITLGATTWLDEWTKTLAGRNVAVCFDVGAEAYATRAVEQLRRVGCEAVRADLRLLGLTERNADLTDWLRGGRYAANELRRLIRESR